QKVAAHAYVDRAPAITVQRARDGPAPPLHVTRKMRQNARTIHRRIEPAGHRQDGVPDSFRFESAYRQPMPEPVFRIDARMGRVGSAGLLVSAGKTHEAVHALDGPAALDKLGRQVVQKPWMGWLLPHAAEVIWSADDAGPEMVLPQAIDQDTCAERV